MNKNVLVVDDDQEMLFSLKEGFEKYSETFSVLTARDGLIALERLKEHTISLVVTDLKMPRMDGFNLLSHIMEHYPEIPVIVITGFSTAKMEKLARSGGAVGYIEKPFMIEGLAKKVLATLRKESDGGTLHSVSSGMFLQLVEMEQKTCTIRVVDRTSEKQGVLFFCEGVLFDARVNSLQGKPAAYKIFSWDEVSLSIQNTCAVKKNKIQTDLQAIVFEAMRLKDEAGEADSEISVKGFSEQEQQNAPDPVDTIKGKLEKEIGKEFGWSDIRYNDTWDGLLAQMKRIGAFFELGELGLAYFDTKGSEDLLLLPGRDTIAVTLSSNCPRDKIIQILGDY